MRCACVGVGLLMTVACSSESNAHSDVAIPASSRYPVASIDGTARDGLRQRDVPYRVRAPTNLTGAVPIVLISHGGSGSRRGYTTGEHVGDALAASGFVAVHVGHLPSMNADTHLIDRPADVSVLLDRLEDGSLRLPTDFAGDPETSRVGHVGHSFGAYTSHAVGGAIFNQTYTDARIDAIAPISPQGAGQFNAFDRGPDDNTWASVAIPAYNLVGEDEVDSNPIGTIEEPGWRLTPFRRYGPQADRLLSIVGEQDHRQMWNFGSSAVDTWIGEQLSRFFRVYVAGDTSIDGCTIGDPAGSTVTVRTQRRVADANSQLDKCEG